MKCQTKKYKHCMNSHVESERKKKTHSKRDQISGYQRCGWGKWIKVIKVSSYETKKYWEYSDNMMTTVSTAVFWHI